MNAAVLTVSIMLFFAAAMPGALAHTTVEVEPYEIEVGWAIEPPIVGIRNDFVFKIIENSETANTFVGVKNAFQYLEATAVFGGASKQLNINSDQRVGYYYSPVIPTKTGSYTVDLKGEINGVTIDIPVPVEDVESTAILDFPPTGGTSDQDVVALKNAVSSLQRDIQSIKSGSGISAVTSDYSAYNFAIFGLSIASAAIILAVIALVKRK